MKVVTFIYHDFEDRNSSTYQFRASCDRFGYEVVNVCADGKERNYGEVLSLIYCAFKEIPPDEVAMYADGADTVFLRPINGPSDKILYMTEKGLWPDTQKMLDTWNRHFADYPPKTPWKYINGGGYIGPAGLICEWYERHGLNNVGTIAPHQSQERQALAYMAAKESGFPIELDQHCTEMQTIGFADPGEFEVINGQIKNAITGTFPAHFHGNGRTPMGWVYELTKQMQSV